MIPMSCPNCGRRGNVPPDRLNTRMHCKKCDAIFHMDSTGKIMLGEPGGRGKAPKPKKSAADRGEPPDILGALAESKATKPVLALVVLCVVGYFAYTAVARMIRKGAAPEALDYRTNYAGEAFVDNDADKLHKITLPGTEGEVDQWLAKLRPEFKFEPPQRPGNDVIVMVAVVTQDQGGKKGESLGTLLPPGGAPVPKPGQKPEDVEKPPVLDFIWVYEGGHWLLDGKQMLAKLEEEAAKAAKDKKKK